MKTKLPRFFSLVLAVILLLLPFSGCGKGRTLDDLKPTDELVLYLPQSMEKYITMDYIVPYRELYPDVRVRMVVVPGDEDLTDDSWPDYTERVVGDTLGGDGPDVLFLRYLPNLDAEKAALNHSILDLTDLLASDPDFHEEDYVDGVMDAVKLDGRQYIMPLSFRVPIYLSDREKLKELGFSWDGIGTTSDFMEELARLTPIAAQNEAFLQLLESKNHFYEMFSAAGIRLLDYEKGTVLPDEAALHDFIRGYRTFYPCDYDPSSPDYMQNFCSEELMRGGYYFWWACYLYSVNWQIDEMMVASHTYEIGTLPSQTGDAVGQIYSAMAINAASKNVLNAYNFIKLMLSEDLQRTNYSTLAPFVPINKGAIRATVDGRFPMRSSAYLTPEERDAIYETYTGMDRFTPMPRESLFDMLWEAMLPYLQDDASYEDCLTELKRKLTFYLSE